MHDNLHEKSKMPLTEALLKYKNENVYPMHTPGHKGGRGMESSLRRELGESVRMDVSLMSELDDIHEPESYIAAAQELAAEAYGSDACFWAVNGTSQAIHAMLMTALAPGETVLLPRNAHRSVAGGLVLGGIRAVFVEPDYCSKFGIYTQVSAAAVEEKLRQHQEIRAVLITTPNYYGVAADTEKIAAVCHRYGVPLLVDEAHGAHLGFSDSLPPSAMQCGADACAQSTHKILGAMTQCSMLHVKKPLLDVQRAADIMSLLTTTSPNYLLMASLDAARAQVQQNGAAMAEQALAAAEKLRRVCGGFAGLKVLEQADLGGYGLDTAKVTVNFSDLGYTGIEAGELLRKAGIAVELVDAENVLFLVTYADDNREFEDILNKIAVVFAAMEKEKRTVQPRVQLPAMPEAEMGLSVRDVFFSPKESVPLADSIGRICAEQISFYPPGIPVVLPGERISGEIADYCAVLKKMGLPVSGPADSFLRTVRVVKE